MKKIHLTIFLLIFFSLAHSQSPLLIAIKQNNLKEVAKLLSQKADANTVDTDGDNALMYAALYSTADCMKLLLDKGANPNATNKRNETALMWSTNDIAKVKVLLEHKADPNSKTTEGNTPFLSGCVGANQSEVIRLMLKYGADPKVMNGRNETTLINIALLGDTADARLMLTKGVNINAKGFDGLPALVYAIKAGNNVMVDWLLTNGANANQLDGYQSLPITWAATIGDMQLIDKLLPLTKDINIQDIDSITVLMWAAYSEHDNPDVIQAILNAGANPNLKDKKGKTALDWAKKKGNTSTVAILRNVTAKTN